MFTISSFRSFANMASLRKEDQRKRGFTPFANDPWTGPGNDPFVGPLQTLTGYISRNHDNEYQEYEDKYGVNPKYYWTDADRRAIQEWERTGEWSGQIAAYVFKAKKFLFDHGLISGMSLYNLRWFAYVEIFVLGKQLLMVTLVL